MTKFLHLFVLIAIFSTINTFAQSTPEDTKRYFVFFKDKNHSPYQIDQPQAYLSARSINRRRRQRIPITQRDLPVSPQYRDNIQHLGVNVWYASKWFNGLIIEANIDQLKRLHDLPFVDSVLVLKSVPTPQKMHDPNVRDLPFKPKKIFNTPTNTRAMLHINDKSDYGRAYNQSHMLEADKMHQEGYRGQGMIIAVFDAGFDNVDNIKAFEHLFQDKRILGIYDFVDQEKSVFENDAHGRMVLSCMAAYEPRKIIGTAPEAAYYLFRTEDNSTEYRVEEFNWLIAAEKADSLGVDVINTSLGYNYFDDETMNYTLPQMDGKTAYISRAAQLATEVGMIVVSSAGNEGNNNWKHITAPADAPSVLSVGAVNPKGKHADFSSKGIDYKNGQIKPNLVAQGHITTVSRLKRVGISSGTSFSSPVLAGFVTSFWGAYPHIPAQDLIKILCNSAHQASNPDYLLGYGIPSYTRAKVLADKYPKPKQDSIIKQDLPTKKLELILKP